MADSQSCREGPSILFSGREEIRRGQSLRSKGPRADVGFLGMGTGQLAPSPSPMGDLGNAVSSPSEVWVEPRLLKGVFIAFWRHQMASPGTCWRTSSGGGALPLKSAYATGRWHHRLYHRHWPRPARPSTPPSAAEISFRRAVWIAPLTNE